LIKDGINNVFTLPWNTLNFFAGYIFPIFVLISSSLTQAYIQVK